MQQSEPDFQYEGFIAEIKISNLSFKYKENSDFEIKDLSLIFEPGKKIAIVGSSGSGKTTLVDLILGLIEPESGSVKISGLDPKIAIQKWPGAIAYMPQDVPIVQGSVRNNVALGFKSEFATDEKVKTALKKARLYEHIQNLENYLDSPVGESGSSLSGGQRQRLGIARTLFTNPKLIILDEATSALDAKTEEEVNREFENLGVDSSLVVIAHRFSTVVNSDVIVYLERGKVVAKGNFESVKKAVPNFENLAKLQGL